jgi:hypothetical protein
MAFTADQIEDYVKQLTELKSTHSIEELNAMTQFDEFRLQNRIFYEMIISSEGVNQVVFREMMKMKRRLEAGEDQYSVDVKFGRFMAGKYVDPVVNKKN